MTANACSDVCMLQQADSTFRSVPEGMPCLMREAVQQSGRMIVTYLYLILVLIYKAGKVQDMGSLRGA